MKKIRILAVDDEKDILNSYKAIFGEDMYRDLFATISTEGERLFNGKQNHDATKHVFELVTCLQGDEAVRKVAKSGEEGKPFSVAFIDIRMPPGPDGVWTAKQIHSLDPGINIIIVTGYSDVPPQKITRQLTTPARLFYIQKPFHFDEIYQFAVALSENWQIHKELQEQFAAIDKEINELNDEAGIGHENLEGMFPGNIHLQEELNAKTRQIEEINTALRVLLSEKERDKKKIEASIRFNINEYISPYLAKLKKTALTPRQSMLVSTIEKNLLSLTSSFTSNVAPKHLNFTPVELQVAKLIKHGNTSKDIAELLNLSILTVESYRKNIRKKMGLTNKKENLRTTLLEYF